MQPTLKKNLDRIEQHRNVLREEYHVRRIGIFGSVARGDDTPKSDIDVLVEFSQPVGLFHFVGLEQELSRILRKKVDLVTKRGLKPAIKKDVLNEVVYVETKS